MVHRHAARRWRAHHRADCRGRGANDHCSGHRIVPAVVVVAATAVALHVYVDVSRSVDVVDAGVSDIVGAYIGVSVVDLRRLPVAAPGLLGARAASATALSAGLCATAPTSAAPTSA